MSSDLESKFELLEKNLEKLQDIALAKIEEKSTPQETVNNDDEIDDLKSKIAEQRKIIQNLSRELNSSQKIIKEIGKENDFLKDKNRLFADKIFKLKSQGTKLILSIEEEFEQVKNIIKKKLK